MASGEARYGKKAKSGQNKMYKNELRRDKNKRRKQERHLKRVQKKAAHLVRRYLDGKPVTVGPLIADIIPKEGSDAS